MRICYISQEYPPETHVGGIGTYTYNVASKLAEQGHEIHVISSTKSTDFTYQDNGVWVHRVKKWKVIPAELSRFSYSYLLSKKLSQFNSEFDVVQSSEFGGEAFWYAMKKRCPLVTRLATPFFLTERLNGKRNSKFRPFSDWMEKKQTLWSDGIFASTAALAKVVKEEWGIESSKVEIIPNTINISRVLKLGRNRQAPEALQNKAFLLYFGRLEERKGIHILAHALPAVFREFPRLHMVFVGSDLGYRGLSFREYVRNVVQNHKNRILFFDNLPQEKLFPILNLAKMVILPSLWEAFGFVCLEAMALGRPVVATSGSGFEEIIENNTSGYLVEPGKSELLVERLIRVLRDDNNLTRISSGARKRAQDFEVSTIADRLLSYYQEVREKWLSQEPGVKINSSAS